MSREITVCLFAWNEEKRILRAIQSFFESFEILVVDNYSTDRTVEIVRSAGYNAIKVKNPGFIETPEVMELVQGACRTEYMLIASVSEIVPFKLLQRYADVANSKSYDVVRAFRESITAGQPIPISGKPTKNFPGELRFFRKGAVSYARNHVHGRGSIVCLPERVLSVVTEKSMHFYQFRDYDCSKTEQVLCRYDDLLAKQRYESGDRFSWRNAIWRSLRSFVASYFWYGSYKFGMLGFVHSYYRWHMEFTIWLRIWEWQSACTNEQVIIKNDMMRSKIEEKSKNNAMSASSAQQNEVKNA